MTEQEKFELILKLEELVGEFEDVIDELGKAFEPLRPIINDFERSTHTKVMNRGDLAGVESFLGIMWWTGQSPQASEFLQTMENVIKEISMTPAEEIE